VDGNFKPYSYADSSARIKEILDQPAGMFVEVEGGVGLPDRDRLTFTNGFYGHCSAVFIDIRDSSKLTETHKRPALAKIYRAFISEMVAVLNSDPLVLEVNIVGDCVWAVYKTQLKSYIDDVFSIAAKANTLVKLLNHHLEKKGIGALRIGVGVDYGRVLMIKAGFSSSGINDVVYMGDVVNRAAHLAHEAGRAGRHPIFVGAVFQQNLTDHNQQLLSVAYVPGIYDAYAGDVVNVEMNKWVEGLS
jgi:class 3 adenylate cyclase